jgi:hypothetical protein
MKNESLKKIYRSFSKRYDPRGIGKDIRILFIAESPPKPKNLENPDYFYNETSQHRKGALWWHFNEALYNGKFSEKSEFLSRFQQDGYFLIDVFQTEQELIDIRKQVKEEDYKNAVKVSKNLFDRIHELNPGKVVFLGKGTASLIAGSLPFHSQANAVRFKKFIDASVADIKKK